MLDPIGSHAQISSSSRFEVRTFRPEVPRHGNPKIIFRLDAHRA
jgi:hypothetical protein